LERKIVIGGKYKHFKGNEYLVLMLAKDSETGEEVVVYKALYGNNDIWVRPLKMFLEQIARYGEKINRFELVMGEIE